MEAIWIIPLYFICPLIGIILLINSVLKFKERRNKFILGIILISLPILHLIVIDNKETYIDKNIFGHYELNGKKDILIIKENGTFELKKTEEFGEAGNGKWEIFHIDSDNLYLNLGNSRSFDFDITKKGNNIELESRSSENINYEKLIKQ